MRLIIGVVHVGVCEWVMFHREFFALIAPEFPHREAVLVSSGANPAGLVVCDTKAQAEALMGVSLAIDKQVLRIRPMVEVTGELKPLSRPQTGKQDGKSHMCQLCGDGHHVAKQCPRIRPVRRSNQKSSESDDSDDDAKRRSKGKTSKEKRRLLPLDESSHSSQSDSSVSKGSSSDGKTKKKEKKGKDLDEAIPLVSKNHRSCGVLTDQAVNCF